MAVSDPPSTTAAAANSPSQHPGDFVSDTSARSITPVEMSTIQSPSSELLREFTTSESTATTTSTTVPSPQHDTRPKSKSQSQPLVQPQSTSVASESVSRSAPSNPTAPTPAPALNRAESEAIGPSTDTPAIKPDTSNGPVVVITLLLTSGARHPYKIDEKYLKKRNVNVEAMDPFNISVYTLKELIWRDWREEWEPRPTSPSSIRLIHFGRMLDDKAPLTDCRFQVESPNVVHMTVKPQEVVDEEDAKTAKGGSRRDGDDESHAGCRCVIL